MCIFYYCVNSSFSHPSFFSPNSLSGKLTGIYTGIHCCIHTDLRIQFFTECPVKPTWAERLGQSKTYDGAYLAAAETLNVEFWTADRRLTRSAHQAGATWVHSIFETTNSD